MKKFSVKVEKEIIVEFDENSEEFKALWDIYKQYFDSDADYESLAESVASIIARYGTLEMIEGFGFVKLNGENQNIYKNGKNKNNPSCINVNVETDINRMVDFDISEINIIEE